MKLQQHIKLYCSRVPRLNHRQKQSTTQLCHSTLYYTTSCLKHQQSINNNNTKSTTSQTTHFGYETIPLDDKINRVGAVFSRVASVYDTMNDVMSLGIHRVWKDIFINMLNPTATTQLLDVGGGTGDIAFRFINAVRHNTQFNALNSNQPVTASVIVSDINNDMLSVGKQRAAELGYLNTTPHISFEQANAEELPFDSDKFDAYTIAFCLRNVTTPENALAEAYRVLRPGGRFMCLEFSQVTNPLFRTVYDTYSTYVIPKMGEAIANDRHSYQYLVESIRKFPNQDTLADMMRAAGFKAVNYTNLTGGIVAIHSGYKL